MDQCRQSSSAHSVESVGEPALGDDWVFVLTDGLDLREGRRRAVASRSDGGSRRLVRPSRKWRRYLPVSLALRLSTPSAFTGIVFVEDAEMQSLLPVRASAPPRQERTCIANSRLRVQIVRLQDQRLPLGVENASVGLVRPGAGHIVDLRNADGG